MSSAEADGELYLISPFSAIWIASIHIPVGFPATLYWMSCHSDNNKPRRWNWTRWPLLAESDEASCPKLTRDPQHWILSKLKICTARWRTLSIIPVSWTISDSWNILYPYNPQSLSTWRRPVSEICSCWRSRKFVHERTLFSKHSPYISC